MPVVPSSAYRPLSQVTFLVRALLNDQQGATWTDAFQMPFVASAYRKVQKALANVGQQTFVADEVLLVVPKVATIDPSLQVALTDATAPPNQLPTDMVAPDRLWERVNLSGDSFVDMVDMTEHGGLPSEPQGEELIYWEWRSDGIYFLGALQDTQIRLRYTKFLADPTDPKSQILIRNAIDAVAYVTAALGAVARGAPQAEALDTAATDALHDLEQQSVRRSQKTGRRRKPFSRRAGGGIWC
jgi:hypothetical protein